MAYTIYRSDGVAVTVPDNAIDSQFYNPNTNGPNIGMGIRLNGRNAIDYGAPTAQTWLQMTENFANISGRQPIGQYALEGQLWYDKSISALYVRVTPGTPGTDSMANWNLVATVADPAAVTGTEGQIRVDGTGKVFVWTNLPGPPAWRQIFPAIYS